MLEAGAALLAAPLVGGLASSVEAAQTLGRAGSGPFSSSVRRELLRGKYAPVAPFDPRVGKTGRCVSFRPTIQLE